MDASVKQKVTPEISEENRLRHFQSLHSNDLLNPDQQNVVNEFTKTARQQDAITPLRLANHGNNKLDKLQSRERRSCLIERWISMEI